MCCCKQSGGSFRNKFRWLKYAHQNGCKMDYLTFINVEAGRNGHIECMIICNRK